MFEIGDTHACSLSGEMEKDFRVCLVKASLLWSLAFLILKGASCADEPKCEISCRLGDGPKDEDTVDPDFFIPSHCSIKNDGNISRNMTWKEVNDKITPKPGVQCLVLKTGNSERRVYFASPLTIRRWGSPVYLDENTMNRKDVKCIFKGRPRPQITWYKDGSNLKTFNHTEEVEKLQDNGVLKVTTTLHVPGREEFAGIYHCVGNNSLSGGWSSIKEPADGIEVLIKCPGTNITRSGPKETEANAFSNITLSCLVAKAVAELDDLRLTWNFKNQSDPLKTGGKYRIPALEPISGCRRPFKLEIINVTADDEGVYSCHQTCKDSDGDVCKSSAQFELKVYSPPPTRTVTNSTKAPGNTSPEETEAPTVPPETETPVFPPSVQAVTNSTKAPGNTSPEETEAPTVPPETETPVFPPSVQAVTPSKPERWLTPVLTLSVGVFVLLTSVVIFHCKKKRTYKGTERHEEDGEILL